ncbi:hypothetical protein [Amycolatopsis pithecellobii]|uniref:hypothetical protein n=1 Tax=Amycolatopsis pithecellobii TaxID=664692 RepID=UPI00140DA9BA|nr:hypothetical protein [Amycolatopsis pithecellobii]
MSDRIAAWHLGTDRFFLLSGGPGTGKTMISALTLANDTTNLWTASYFCSNRLTGFSYHPRQFVMRIQENLLDHYPQAYLSRELRTLMNFTANVSADSVPGTATGIAIGHLTASPISLDDYFQTMIIEPLHEISRLYPDARPGILIDGLDEAVAHEGTGIHDLMAKYASAFPGNCKILITSQNTPRIIDSLLAAAQDVVHLDLSEKDNRATASDDVRNYVRNALSAAPATKEIADDIAESAQGNFLWAGSLVREVLGDAGVDHAITDHNGLDRYYAGLLDRLKRAVDDDPAIDWTHDCLALMHCLAVAQTALSSRQLAALLEIGEPRLSVALRVMRTFLQVDSGYESISLEHKSVAQFLLTPTLSDGSPNSHAVREDEAHRAVADRIVRQLAEEWHGRWSDADSYAVMYLAAHLNRLRSLTGAPPGYTREQVRLPELARRIGTDPALAGDHYEAMSQVLIASRRLWPEHEYEAVVAESAQSSDPYVRAAVVDALVESAGVDPARTGRIVYDLLKSEHLHAWTTALYAAMRLQPKSRHEIVLWIACHGTAELRTYAGYMLYLLAGGDRELIAAGMLKAVAQNISVVRIARTRRILEFLSNISITAYVNNCDDPAVAIATSELWQYIAIKRLHLRLVNRPALEKPIISVAAKRIASRLVENDVLRGQIGALPERYQDLAGQLLPALTPGHDLSGLIGPLRDGFSSDAWAPRILSGCVVAVQAITDLDACARPLDELFSESTADARLWQVVAFAVLLKRTPEALPDRLAAMTGKVLTEHRASLVRYLAGDGASVNLFAVTLPLAYAKHGRPLTDLVTGALEDDDETVRQSNLEGLAAVGLYYPDAVLAALAQVRDPFGREEVRAGLLRILSRMYPMHPTMVDVFLREMGPVARLGGLEAGEMDFARHYVDALGLYNNAVHQAIHYPLMRREVLGAGFAEMFQARTPGDFIKNYARRIMKLLRDSEYEVIRWTR